MDFKFGKLKRIVGAALNEGEFSGANPDAVAIIKAQFNTISPENVLQWESVHPLPGKFDFTAADRYVGFAFERSARHGRVNGHLGRLPAKRTRNGFANFHAQNLTALG